ncbi:MAG TPA: hypothetical protein VFT74_04520, partial [Isosphaeraceae bacterium]|nr:hypothetical protein [Isosphaeraceae bacterium]
MQASEPFAGSRRGGCAAPFRFSGNGRRARSFVTRSATSMRVWPGRPYPLGASWDGAGVNFALFSENATKVELCLFDSIDDKTPTHTVMMPEQSD